MNIGFYSYLGAAMAYGFFSVLLLFSWGASFQGRLLVLSMMVCAIWAAVSVQFSLDAIQYLNLYQSVEILRFAALLSFLLMLSIKSIASSVRHRNYFYTVLSAVLVMSCFLVIYVNVSNDNLSVVHLTVNVIFAMIGLVTIEQLYRNLPRYRWAMKHLFIGFGAILLYDFYMYADALLFRSIDRNLWEARGAVNIVAVPLIAISAVRSKNWSLSLFVSREVILNTATMLGGGVYLLLMASAGYYLREFGGDWGQISQTTFIIVAVIMLVVLLTSSQVRSKLRVFLGKHFYKNKYDYRQEWLRLTEELETKFSSEKRFEAVIKVLAHLVEARSGVFVLLNKNPALNSIFGWQVKMSDDNFDDVELIKFLEKKKYIININELKSHENEYEDLKVPGWIVDMEQSWLIVPLINQGSLMGYVVLCNPLVNRAINWEDRDLLKTAAKQVSSYLTVLITSDSLSEAKQFEVFSRLSAYMVHDLKNISSELEMIALNAKKHDANPEFVADAFETVENAAGDINRLLSQLRNRRVEEEKKVEVHLSDVLQKVIECQPQDGPVPVLKIPVDCEQVFVTLQKDRFYNVILHLVENARQAIDDKERGAINIYMECGRKMILLRIEDNGHGMDADFIRERLFKPFDTTKGNAGMGIGVHESRDFIRKLGGDIKVHSEVGVGTVFTVSVPICNKKHEVSPL